MLEVMDVEYTRELPASLIRVLITDDSDLWNDFVIAGLKERPDLHIVGFASDGLEALRKAEELLTDAKDPDFN